MLFRSRGTLIEIEDPVTGTMLRMPNMPFRMAGKPSKIRFPGLPHGAANAALYEDLLGYSPDAVEKLKAAKAI